jgi:addiction module HigA family antidote
MILRTPARSSGGLSQGARSEVTEAAKSLGVTRKTLSSILNGHSGVTPEMALRLSKAFGTIPEHWLQMRDLDRSVISFDSAIEQHSKSVYDTNRMV